MLDAATLITIVGLVLIVLAIVATYLGSRTWHVGHALLVLSIFLFSIVYWYLAAAVLNKQQEQRAQINQLETNLAEATAQAKALLEGESVFEPSEVPRVDSLFAADEPDENYTPPELGDGIRGRRIQLYRWIIDRGQVWSGATPLEVDAETGAADVALASDQPHSIQPATLMFVFESGSPQRDADDNPGAQYLGEFQVASVEKEVLKLKPTRKLTESERQRIANSDATWTLYNVMPVDRPELLAHLTDDELRALFPDSTEDEFLKDGEKAAADDPQERQIGILPDGTPAGPDDDRDEVVEWRYQRQLRNYEAALSTEAARWEAAQNRIAQLTNDGERLRKASELAKAELADRGRERQQLAADGQMLERELTVLKEYDVALNRRYNGVRDLAIHLHRENRQTAAALAQLNSAVASPAGAAKFSTSASVVASP